jgi:coenzyme PQQ precursor peptide PqqA
MEAMMAKKVWTKPRVIEIAVGMEINSYACAIRDV